MQHDNTRIGGLQICFAGPNDSKEYKKKPTRAQMHVTGKETGDWSKKHNKGIIDFLFENYPTSIQWKQSQPFHK